ncbi:MAG TPA: lysylphosphatidylglycerol synthase transmembrane domain-containing protein [Gemmatimonadales bacterium]|jgi:hypothetical protein
MRKTSWRVAQALAGLVIVVVLIRSFVANWHTVEDQPVQWQIHWEYIGASLVITWAMYGVLIWGWRAVLAGWREQMRIVDAARVWTISSLGKYIPGKIWSIAGMAMMSQRYGVSGSAATGSAIVMQLISLATGAMLALALSGTDLLDRLAGGWGSIGAMALAAVAILSAVALTSPSLTRRVGFLLRRPDTVRPVDPSALAGALFANLVAWAGYGVAFQLLALGTMRDVQVSWTVATGAFAASYIVGYLAILLPGGLLVRETMLITLLTASGVELHTATALAVVSRIALTINDIGAAAPFLLSRSKPRVLINAS